MTVHTLDLGALFGPDASALISHRPPHGLALDATGQRLAVNVGYALHEFDLREATRSQEYSLDDAPFDPSESWCVSMRYTLDARVLGAVYVQQNGAEGWSYARLFERATGRRIAEPALADHVMFMAFDADGEYVLSFDLWSLRVHRARDGAELARREFDQHGGAAWDPISGHVVVLDQTVVRALDPRSLQELRRYEIPAERARDFVGNGIHLRPLHLRSSDDLSSQGAQLPMQWLDLPWGARLWLDPFENHEGLLWLSEDGERAVVRRLTCIERLRAGEAPETLLDLNAYAHDAWIDATVSDDGDVFAWRDDERVQWRRIDD